MILLFNVKITSHGLSYYHRNPWLTRNTRMDIFKYCLASYAALLPVLSKCILYIQVEPEFENRREELNAWIHELFPADKLELHWHRNNYTREWRALSERFADDDLIWFAGNDDHIFIDYDLDVINAGINLLQQDPDPWSVIYYSHWPEQMRLCMHYNGQLTADGNYIKFIWRTFDGIRIFKGARFKRYWHDNDLGDDIVYRTDHLYHIGYQLTGPVYAPTRELVRHYDGYSHVSPEIINIAPPLTIPPGFFEKNMQIRLGYSDRDPGAVNMNPLETNLFSADQNGTDYKWVMSDIPLFWRDRIASVNINPSADQNAMIRARNSAFLSMSRVNMNCYTIQFGAENTAPLEWFNNHLK